MKKYFVTGGSGFIGSCLVKHLRQYGADVVTTITPQENDVTGATKIFCSRNGYAEELLKSTSSDAIDGVDAVIHLAETTDIELFNRLADRGCKQFSYASTAAVYGHGESPYSEANTPISPLTSWAKGKAEFERQATQFAVTRGVNVVGLRLGEVYGPGERYKGKSASLVRQLLSQISMGITPNLFWDGSQRRDWLHVSDAAQAFIAAAKAEVGGKVVNIGYGKSWSVSKLLSIIGDIADTKYNTKWITNPDQRSYQYHVESDISYAKDLIGFNPYFDIYSGISDYLRNWD